MGDENAAGRGETLLNINREVHKLTLTRVPKTDLKLN